MSTLFCQCVTQTAPPASVEALAALSLLRLIPPASTALLRLNLLSDSNSAAAVFPQGLMKVWAYLRGVDPLKVWRDKETHSWGMSLLYLLWRKAVMKCRNLLTFTKCLSPSDSRESRGGDQRMQRAGVQGPLWELQTLQTVWCRAGAF